MSQHPGPEPASGGQMSQHSSIHPGWGGQMSEHLLPIYPDTSSHRVQRRNPGGIPRI